ncbi:MAG: hypothetical protein LBL35_07755 [Clostridiales bacterium]|jgi:hypothetical protein|nr:hypothetical protein [Clostridiales bacterium]
MNKLAATSLIASGLLGAAGIAYAVSDKTTRRRMMRDGARVIKRAGRIIDFS